MTNMSLSKYYTKAGISPPKPWMDEIKMQFNPRRHQITGLNACCRDLRYGLYDEQGTGKTLIAQAFAIWQASGGNRVIVCMPPVLLRQFIEELLAVFKGISNYLKIELYNGNPVQRQAQRDLWATLGIPDILIMSYNRFKDFVYTRKQRTPDFTANEPYKNTKLSVLEAMFLKENGFNVLIADEATAIKKPSSKVHKVFKKFLGKEGDTALLLMTGTPAENVLSDLYGYISLITPRAYGSFKKFEQTHIVYNPYSHFKEVEGYKNLEFLTQRLYSQGRRIEKVDVLSLPPKVFTEIPVDLDPRHLSLYRKLAKERILQLKDRIIDAELEQSLRQKLMQICLTPDRFSDITIPNTPLETVKQLVSSIGIKTTKVLMYCHFKATIKMLEEAFKELNPVTIYSESKGKKATLINKFKHNDECRLMIANYISGGVGLNLQSVCSNVIFVEPTSVPGRLSQASDRVHRSGQTETCNFYLITPLKTISVDTRNLMLDKDIQNRSITLDKHQLFEASLGKVERIGSITDFKDQQLTDSTTKG